MLGRQRFVISGLGRVTRQCASRPVAYACASYRNFHAAEKQDSSVSPASVQIKHHDFPLEKEMQEKKEFFDEVSKNEGLRNTMAYTLSFADSGSAEDYAAFSKLTNARMREQLAESSRMATSHNFDLNPLPRTVQEALRPTNRAIVITETSRPFKVVDVNKAWEGLCGYSFVEVQGKSLGSFLRGPETDPSSVTALLSQLLKGEEAGTVLVNYKKDGTRFRNHLRVGPLFESGEISHFVGVLQELH